jgi:uncharacterized protein YbjT (DUF2867 family)
MKVLIIGASGMLALPVIQELDRRGFDLRLFSRKVNAAMFRKDYDIVNGDVMNPYDLKKAIAGCDAIHVSLSGVDESAAMKEITTVAREEGIKLISTLSGCTVSEENRWFPMIDNKFRAEQELMNCGVPYMIFRASWFFESLELMVRNGKATMIGKQPHPSHWIAAQDYARMVGEAYASTSARNKIFYIMGEKPYLMKDLLKDYCAEVHPEIKKLSNVSVGMLKMIAMIGRNKSLKEVAEMFGYFEKTKEKGDISETWNLLGKPTTDFQKWLQIRD